MTSLIIEPNIAEAEVFLPMKPTWCKSDQTLTDAATLMAFAQYAKPKTMLEIGSSAGEGAAALLYATRELHSHLHGLDLSPTVYYDKSKPIGSVVFEAFPGFAERYTVKTGVRCDAVPTIDAKFDLVHIDANHSHPWGVYDFLWALPSLNQGALVAFHDANYLAAISQAAFYFARLIPNGAFVGNHFAFVYEGPTQTLFDAIMECLEINWQSSIPASSCAGLQVALSTVFSDAQAMQIASRVLAQNANYHKFSKLYEEVHKALWQRELQRRALLAEQKPTN
ncbi:class I SAM-dependent methyltransferase [Rhizobium sp. GN54]|uniref:class I SAM-dependent methyltransferase n=1 Tax=Rhizobium sp. GN54 TaxID=2898150 RepID=UPI001E394C82|nr:class I SAM-dependent methyltransferase [Rhizobium sp. GN54]MCD2183567.1 class I SAM-dependent methyltransferase [Rhizobium sp. GN54]